MTFQRNYYESLVLIIHDKYNKSALMSREVGRYQRGNQKKNINRRTDNTMFTRKKTNNDPRAQYTEN